MAASIELRHGRRQRCWFWVGVLVLKIVKQVGSYSRHACSVKCDDVEVGGEKEWRSA